MERRTFLKGAVIAGASPAVALAPIMANRPEDRIRAAMNELHSAMAELHPGWRIQRRDDVIHPTTGKGVELPANRHAIVLYASAEAYGPEEVRWFVKT